MLDSLRLKVRGWVARLGGAPAKAEADVAEAFLDDTGPLAPAQGGRPEGRTRRGTSYLAREPAVPGQEHPTANLRTGVDPSARPDERKLGKAVGADAGGELAGALARHGPRAFPFKTLVIGRLTALPGLLERLREAQAARDLEQVTEASLALQEACGILEDEVVHAGARVTKLASHLEKALKGKDKDAARAMAAELQAGLGAFEAAVEAKRLSAFGTGEKLARAAVGKNYAGVAEIAPLFARDAGIIAFLLTQTYPFMNGDLDLEGSLTERMLRMQQALISRDWAAASRLGRQMSVQATIMGDPTVKVAVQLIASARRVRELTRKVSQAGPDAQARLTELTRRLTAAVPGLAWRVEEYLGDIGPWTAQLGAAIDDRDYAAGAVLAARILHSAQVAQHGIVAKAASLTTVTSALEDAALSGKADNIITLLEGV